MTAQLPAQQRPAAFAKVSATAPAPIISRRVNPSLMSPETRGAPAPRNRLGRNAQLAHRQPHRKHLVDRAALLDRSDSIASTSASPACCRVLRDGGERRAREARRRNVVEADDRDLFAESARPIACSACMRADRGDVAGGEDRVELDPRVPSSSVDRGAPRRFARFGIDAQPLVGLDPGGAQRPAIAAPAVEEFRVAGCAVPTNAILRRPCWSRCSVASKPPCSLSDQTVAPICPRRPSPSARNACRARPAARAAADIRDSRRSRAG